MAGAFTLSGDVLAALHARRSVPPRRLRPPGPDAIAVDRIVAAGLAAPDHGRLRPWRILLLERKALADLFVEALAARNGTAEQAAIEHERGKSFNAPVQLALIGETAADHAAIPVHEQWIAIGAALQNMFLAIESLGFAAKIHSGHRCTDPVIRSGLGLAASETLVGFISVGTVSQEPPRRVRPEAGSVMHFWPA